MFNASKEEVSVTTRILEIFACGIRNLGRKSPEYRSRNLVSKVHWHDVDESWIQYLESRIHDLESRIQDCFEFPLMGCYFTLEYLVMCYIEGPQ